MSGPKQDPTVHRRGVGPGGENGAQSPKRAFPPKIPSGRGTSQMPFLQVSPPAPLLRLTVDEPAFPASTAGRAGRDRGGQGPGWAGTCQFQGARTKPRGGNHTWTKQAACRLGAQVLWMTPCRAPVSCWLCFWNVLGANPTPTLFGVGAPFPSPGPTPPPKALSGTPGVRVQGEGGEGGTVGTA